MRHAYLIIAHEDNYVLKTLIELLDDRRNDIFIHLDKKTVKFSFEYYEKFKNAKIYFIPRKKVYWGGFSQVEVELELLKFAIKKDNYDYFHLLSGADLPLKTQDEIYSFFKENNGKEFIGISKENRENYIERIKYYYFESLRTRRKVKIIRRIHRKFEKLQKIINVRRNKDISIYKGGQWFSLTNDFIQYILKNEKIIKKIFHHTFCPDELFMQTMIMNSNYKEKIFDINNSDDNKAAMRYIDWQRGKPYIFNKKDYNLLMNSEMLFARKFSENKDKEIIERIKENLKSNNKMSN